MSDDNVSRFLKKYAAQARIGNPHVPEHVHPHMFRHSRAMHLYHEDPETTLIYAYADTEMKRQAVEKASQDSLAFALKDNSPIWESQNIIEQLIRGY